MEYRNTVFDVLDHGEIELLDVLGNDLAIVNAAKVSFVAETKELNEAAIGLINYLLKNKHATPFEHVVFKFRIKAPIFVAREWFRHRWSSFNEMSMRYHVPPTIDFYLPESKNIRRQVGKPGAYTFEEIESQEVKQMVLQRLSDVYKHSEMVYRDLLDLGIAKEIARCALPVAQYTEFIWTVNARSLLNFLALRNEENAQLEIREYASVIEDLFAKVLPITHEAFVKAERQAI